MAIIIGKNCIQCGELFFADHGFHDRCRYCRSWDSTKRGESDRSRETERSEADRGRDDERSDRAKSGRAQRGLTGRDQRQGVDKHEHDEGVL